MKITFPVLLLTSAVLSASLVAEDRAAPSADKSSAEEPAAAEKAPELTDAAKVVREHMEGFFTADIKMATAGYAEKITLLPGHEFLKAKHKLVTNAAGPAEVKREDLRAALEAALKASPLSAERRAEAAAMMKQLVIKSETPAVGSHSVKLQRGELAIPIEEGDEVVTLIPPKSENVAIFHLRKTEGVWKIVSEYFD